MSNIEVKEPMRVRTRNAVYLVEPMHRRAPDFLARYKIRRAIDMTSGNTGHSEWYKQGTELELELEVGRPLRLGSFASVSEVLSVEYIEPHH